MAAVPQLVKLQEELKDSGFAIVAPHAQDGSQEDIAKIARGNKINYMVTSRFDIPGEPVSGLPAAFLFDSSGNLVEKGHPTSLKAKIQDLIKNGPHFLAAGRTYKKHKAEADALKTTKAYGQILKKLEKDLKGEGDAAAEAKYLTERIQAYGKKKLESAKTAEAEDAFAANQTYSEVAANYKGDAIAEDASKRLKELKDDKAFQTELKASTMAHQILAECDKLVAQQGKVNLDYAPNQKTAASVKANASALKKKYPDAKATARVLKDLEGYGFKGI